jgi:murein DD-endopeptidase MepM/ murein hydrolase activator NlpD
MRLWPVPDSFSKTIPILSRPGSFWEDRGDRRHCGVDIYAPQQSKILAIEDGEVIKVGVFTSPDKSSYWHTTRYILIQNATGLVCRYAELADVIVSVGDFVKGGREIATVGSVLDLDKITEKAPMYIQKIREQNLPSMLHFELYQAIPIETDNYLGGNWFGDTKPKNLLDPTDYLRATVQIKTL